MKKYILLIFLFLLAFFSFQMSYATTVKVKVPMDLTPLGITCTGGPNAGGGDGDNHVSTSTYECSIETGFASIQKSIGAIIKYMTFITGLAGVLYIIINGIMLSMSGLSESKAKVKENITKAFFGLILLLLSGLILNMIAPWIYK